MVVDSSDRRANCLLSFSVESTLRYPVGGGSLVMHNVSWVSFPSSISFSGPFDASAGFFTHRFGFGYSVSLLPCYGIMNTTLSAPQTISLLKQTTCYR